MLPPSLPDHQEGRPVPGEPLSTANPTYLNSKVITTAQPIEHGATLQAGQTRFQFLLRAPSEGTDEKTYTLQFAAAEPETVIGSLDSLRGEVPGFFQTFPLSGVMRIGRSGRGILGLGGWGHAAQRRRLRIEGTGTAPAPGASPFGLDPSHPGGESRA